MSLDKLNSPLLDFEGENHFEIRRERFRQLYHRLNISLYRKDNWGRKSRCHSFSIS